MNEKGMSGVLSDRDYFDLMTKNGTELVDVVIKYYPELAQFIKK